MLLIEYLHKLYIKFLLFITYAKFVIHIIHYIKCLLRKHLIYRISELHIGLL